MTYRELLESDEWQERRQEILKRDDNKCTNCGNVELINFSKKEKIRYLFYDEKIKLNTVVVGHDDSEVYEVNVWGEQLPDNFIGNLLFYISDEANRNYLIGIVDSRKALILSGNPRKRSWFIQSLLSELDQNSKLDQLLWILVKGLHVHHKYYQEGLLPWEYPDDALMTLCYKCHEKLHKDGIVEVLDKHGNNIGHYHYCKRCNGAGWFPEYWYFQSGICFRCDGARYEELIINKGKGNVL